MQPHAPTWRERAHGRIPGGTSSPARDTKPMGVPAVVASHGRGAYLYDVDGRRYVDYLQAFGPGILGHGHPAVVAAVQAAMVGGPLHGLAHPAEVRLAERLAQAIPGLERVRFTASGTEAVMSAVRLARHVTGRWRLVKFDAGYHGHSDAVLGHTGSAAAHAGGGPQVFGIPPEVAAQTVTLPWNDGPALAAYLEREGHQVAAVLVEPVAGNIGIVAPDPAFVAAVNGARQRGALVIADEVVSAFRFRYGDASTLVGLEPDLYCLGKIVGGGLPVGAYGGRQELMDEVSPCGPVFQAGTYAGHPAVMAAGLATLWALAAKDVYARLEEKARALAQRLVEEAQAQGVPVALSRVTTAFTLWPGRQEPVRGARDVEEAPQAAFAAMYRGFLRRGVLLPPSRYEAWFVTLAHGDQALEETVRAAREVFAELATERDPESFGEDCHPGEEVEGWHRRKGGGPRSTTRSR